MSVHFRSPIARRVLAICLVWSFSLGTSIVRADDESLQTASIATLLATDQEVDALFFLVLPALAAGDDVVIPMPQLAETLLPTSQNGSDRSITQVATVWRSGLERRRHPATWQRAGRGRQSQLKVPVAEPLSPVAAAGSVLLLARNSGTPQGQPPEFQCRLITATEARERQVVYTHFGLTGTDARPGVFGIHSPWTNRGPPLQSKALSTFLPQFDQISARGFVPTQRSGSTGIGYTLESLLNIPENNSPLGDFLGMELKSHRHHSMSSTASKRMNLFLKEPTWTDGLAHRDRIPKYGYVDDNGRVALYSTVTASENSHGLTLAVDIPRKRVELHYKTHAVAFWTFDILQSRLSEKLTETAFVGASTRGKGRDEEFHYTSVLFCQQPAVESLVSLIQSRDVMVEMRMHIREDGSARNHGTAFRIRQDQLPRLFARTVLCRVPEPSDP